MKKYLSILFLIPIIMSCATSTKDLTVVKNFEPEKYLGKWYEIARLDHSFERGLDYVTATYSMREDGKIKVLNEGVKSDGTQSQAEGKAYVKKSEDKAGELKVSFFLFFYAKYRIIFLDNYEIAVVTSSTKNYLWILARKPQLSEHELRQLEYFCGQNGFDTEKLIYPKQK
ncbi:MAG TPA: lipocalin family protein [Bacteroidales bacterium]|nr:lipocalin family protein [Bacteroidales bacterium]